MNQMIWDKIYAKIKWLRTQPESVKTRYVWVSALVVVAVVALLWIGVFKKYERNSENYEKNLELIEAGKKLENDIKSKIKVPDIKLPEKETPSISPMVSPSVSFEPSPENLK